MEKNTIKFSVLMSVYYKEKASNLSLAIESIVNQTLKPAEFIIVEDGPLTQELYDCIEKYAKEYSIIKILKLEKNSGLGIALNYGLDNCSYDYVARMDSDDISLLDRFEKQFVFLDNNKEIDVLGSSIIEFDDLTNKELSIKNVPLSADDVFKYIKKRNPINHVTAVFKKQAVLDSGGYINCPFFEDYYLWARMINNNKKIANINEVLVKVRAGLSMSNRRGNIKYIKSIINFENKMLNMKIINVFEYLYNISVRCLVALLPNRLRYLLYQKKLRKSIT